MAITKIYIGTIEQVETLFNLKHSLFSIRNYQSLNNNKNVFSVEIRSPDIFYPKLKSIKTINGLIKLFNSQPSEC